MRALVPGWQQRSVEDATFVVPRIVCRHVCFLQVLERLGMLASDSDRLVKWCLSVGLCLSNRNMVERSLIFSEDNCCELA